VFEYHGWVAIRETAGLDDNDARVRQQVREIQECLAELGDYGLLDLRWMNGAPFLHLAGKPNHRGAWGTAILDTFERVGQIAPDPTVSSTCGTTRAISTQTSSASSSSLAAGLPSTQTSCCLR